MGRWFLNEYEKWVYDANAPSEPPHPDQTRAQVVVPADDLAALHGDDLDPDEPFGDVGDWIDPNAPDPTPPEVTNPGHPDYVQPWRPA